MTVERMDGASVVCTMVSFLTRAFEKARPSEAEQLVLVVLTETRIKHETELTVDSQMQGCERP